ncbi:MAG TPA: polysaccharide deacetylase family protein [Candidatus Dormibacteraeota bacterium]
MPSVRVWPRPSRPGRRRPARLAAALAAALAASLAGALQGTGTGTLPQTADAAPVPSPAPSPDDALEDVSAAAGVPLADLLLPDGASDPLPQAAADLRGRTGPRLTVPILMYHYIRVSPGPRDPLGASLSVSPRDFAAQMAALRRAGVHTVALGDVVAALGGGRPLPAHPVVLSFDDGYRDFSTAALPVLEANGFTATVFVVSGFVGRPGYMTAADVAVAAAAGMTIGAHTVHHVALAHIPAALARVEIEVSREVLMRLSGQPVADFAYPYGDTSRAVQAMVAAAGFQDAVTTVYGSSEAPWQQFSLSRVRIEGADSLASFTGKVLGPLRLRTVPGPAVLPAPGGMAERIPGAPY